MISTAFAHRLIDADTLRTTIAAALADPCVEAFHQLWYRQPHTWSMTRYRGLPTLKCPLDLHIYHELIMQIRPTLVIETGTAFGGSALFLADQIAMSGAEGHVVTVDTETRTPTFKALPQITRLLGSSLDPAILDTIRVMADRTEGPVLVSLDADHSAAHVLGELEAYGPLVTPGSYLVVEDTNIAGHPVELGLEDGGPMAAVDTFLAAHPEFVREPLCERFLLTMHPGGWLRRLPKE